jgi:hypothetical protein
LFAHAGATLLIPVDGTAAGNSGGLLILGGGNCRYYPCKDASCSPRNLPTAGKARSKKSLGKEKEIDGEPVSPKAKRKRARENSTSAVGGPGEASLQVVLTPIQDPSTYVFPMTMFHCGHISSVQGNVVKSC